MNNGVIHEEHNLLNYDNNSINSQEIKTKIIIKRPNGKKIKFDGKINKEIINKLDSKLKICVTVIKCNLIDDIHDYVSSNWTYQYKSKSNTLKFYMHKEEDLGIFTFVSWLYPNSDKLIDIVNRYEGTVITHNNANNLYINRSNKKLFLFGETVIFITCYY